MSKIHFSQTEKSFIGNANAIEARAGKDSER
jgi:hypothetical protein